MKKIDVAGLKIDTFTKQELLTTILRSIEVGKKTWITTVYSEFLFAALQDTKIMEMLNKADIAIPDGIGIFWAYKFLSIPLTAKSYWGKIFQAFWQAKYSLAAILFNPKFVQIPGAEKIAGADLIWDLAKLAAENNFSIYILGGFGDTPKIVAEKLSIRYPLLTTHYSNKNPDDPTLHDDIIKVSPDILFVAYGPIKQETWISQNLQNLPVKLAIGLGGTFDYIAGKRLNPPKFLREIGLEWLWRLFTQPHRIKRIWNATFGLVIALIRYKIFSNLPLRPNVVMGILNKENKILVCQRNPNDIRFHSEVFYKRVSLDNYWQLPQGGVNESEDLVKAAQREAAEEIGIKNLELLKISSKINSYVWDSATRLFWTNRNYLYRGQKQNIVYFKFLGNDQEIKLDNHELINYEWIEIEDLDKIIHPERVAVAKIVQEDLL